MTATSKVLWLVMASLAAGCLNCERNEEACFTNGQAAADLSGELPVLSVEGVSEESRVPDTLYVYACGEGDGWQVHKLPAPTVTYGVLPEGAEEAEAASPLEEGKQYSFAFEAEERNPLTSLAALAPIEWTGSFTHGDPDSFVSGDDHCMYVGAESTDEEGAAPARTGRR
jgi:hypothetical protein